MRTGRAIIIFLKSFWLPVSQLSVLNNDINYIQDHDINNEKIMKTPKIKNIYSSTVVLFALSVGFSTQAHDFWIQPQNFWLSPGVSTPTSIQVGHGPDRQPSPISADRITVFRDVGPRGTVDLRPALAKGVGTQNFKLNFATPGSHMVVLETNHTLSNLPFIRFNDYAKLEGIQPIINQRLQTKTTEAPGKETYSRRAKSLIQVGPIDPSAPSLATHVIGLTLEIVPDVNPYTLGPSDSLPVHVLYEGRPLSGALVKLTNLEFDVRPVEMHVTDQAGRASFKVPLKGSWLLNVIWSKPIKNNPQADFDTTFSSLSFAFPPGGLRR